MELRLHASLSVSIGRQPYTDEQQGSLLVRLSADAFPAAELTPLATLLVGGIRHSLALSGPKLRRGRTNVLAFPLAELPPTILLDANATVSFELASVATATPLPFVRLGQSRASQSVLDYTTGAVLTGAERVPLLPNGFDSHFSSASGAAFDERMAFDLARRGFNTIIFGACLDGIFSAQVRGIPTPPNPLFLGRFWPVLRRFSAVVLCCLASWRQDGENGRKTAKNGRNLGEKRARNSGG